MTYVAGVRSFAAVLALILCVVGTDPALAQRRVALVIGNAAYAHTDTLDNAVNDANAMRDLFVTAGFSTVEAKTNLGVSAFRRALANFQLLSQDADVAVVYYSGHGLELDGQNYLIPVDAEIARGVDVQDEGVPLSRVLSAVDGARQLKLVILDACRTNPFKATGKHRSIDRGLARVEPSEANELVAYSARAGTVAADGKPGGNSPYTAALLKNLMTPNLDVELALRRVRDDVLKATNGGQEPFYYGSVGGTELPLSGKAAISEPAVAHEVKTAAPPEPERTARLEPASDPLTDECDRLAAYPYDRSRPLKFAGVSFDAINTKDAIAACRAAHSANLGNTRVTYELGRVLSKMQNPEALNLYRISADAGYTAAMVGLGAYLIDSPVATDKEEAVEWYRRAIKTGDPAGMHNLASAYANGSGLAKDEKEAFRLYHDAAVLGLKESMYTLALKYKDGIGTEKDPTEWRKWLRAAAESGETDAMRELAFAYYNGTDVEKNNKEAMDWFRKGAMSGDANSMYNVGSFYNNGLGGVARNDAEALSWFRKADEKGFVPATSSIGNMYLAGYGVAKDEEEGARWVLKAANLGNPDAMYKLGTLYFNGTGVERNDAEAVKWLRKAVDAGKVDAMVDLGLCYELGRGLPKDFREALGWYRKSADKGNVYGMRNIGLAYWGGRGVKRNYTEAEQWIRKAQDGGNPLAKDDLEKLAKIRRRG